MRLSSVVFFSLLAFTPACSSPPRGGVTKDLGHGFNQSDDGPVTVPLGDDGGDPNSGGVDLSTSATTDDSGVSTGGEDLTPGPDLTVGEPDLLPGCADDDKDGYSICQGDCDDNDPGVHPGAKPNCTNNKDNDCDGIIDAMEDQDKDGYTICTDCNDKDPLINPGAMDVAGSNIDYDCTGKQNSPPMACDTSLAQYKGPATDYAAAMEICPSQFLVSATLIDADTKNKQSREVTPNYGVFVPKAGKNFLVLSTGIAADEAQKPPYVDPENGTDFGNTAKNPESPLKMNCGGQDTSMVNDYTELKLTLKVPTNAKSFSFDFNFMSAEWPEYVCQIYNDKFLVLMNSKASPTATDQNITFDSMGNALTVNNALFTDKTPANFAGTGYEKTTYCDFAFGNVCLGNTLPADPTNSKNAHAGTDWLRTTAPVTPGDTITLRFIVFDEGDGILDSAAIIDNFQWSLNTTTGPGTTHY